MADMPGRARRGTGVHRLPNEVGVHGVNKANVGRTLDRTKREERDEGAQNTVQTLVSACHRLGHQGTYVDRTSK